MGLSFILNDQSIIDNTENIYNYISSISYPAAYFQLIKTAHVPNRGTWETILHIRLSNKTLFVPSNLPDAAGKTMGYPCLYFIYIITN